MHTWVLIGNPGSETATCNVTIGGVAKGQQSIPVNGRVTPTYGGLADGPVKISCNQPVYATERAIFKSSFNEFAGMLPN
jgi:hypothetical protein